MLTNAKTEYAKVCPNELIIGLYDSISSGMRGFLVTTFQIHYSKYLSWRKSDPVTFTFSEIESSSVNISGGGKADRCRYFLELGVEKGTSKGITIQLDD